MGFIDKVRCKKHGLLEETQITQAGADDPPVCLLCLLEIARNQYLAERKPPIRPKDRETAISSYRAWLLGTDHRDLEQDRRAWILEQITQIAVNNEDITLGCYCAPLACHADVLRELILAERDRLENPQNIVVACMTKAWRVTPLETSDPVDVRYLVYPFVDNDRVSFTIMSQTGWKNYAVSFHDSFMSHDEFMELGEFIKSVTG